MVITKVKIGISSRREGVEIRGDTVDLGGADNTLFLDLAGGCKGICFKIYLSNYMFYALLKNVIAHKKHDQKKGKGICSLFLKCFMIFETEFFSLGVYSLPEFSITTVSML